MTPLTLEIKVKANKMQLSVELKTYQIKVEEINASDERKNLQKRGLHFCRASPNQYLGNY